MRSGRRRWSRDPDISAVAEVAAAVITDCRSIAVIEHDGRRARHPRSRSTPRSGRSIPRGRPRAQSRCDRHSSDRLNAIAGARGGRSAAAALCRGPSRRSRARCPAGVPVRRAQLGRRPADRPAVAGARRAGGAQPDWLPTSERFLRTRHYVREPRGWNSSAPPLGLRREVPAPAMGTRVRAPLAAAPPASQVTVEPNAPQRPVGADGGAVADLLLAALHRSAFNISCPASAAVVDMVRTSNMSWSVCLAGSTCAVGAPSAADP